MPNPIQQDEMTEQERAETLARLQEHAATNRVPAPTVLLACNGGPSSEVLDYCATHGLTLDWAYCGAEPQHRAEVTDIRPEGGPPERDHTDALRRNLALRIAALDDDDLKAVSQFMDFMDGKTAA